MANERPRVGGGSEAAVQAGEEYIYMRRKRYRARVHHSSSYSVTLTAFPQKITCK